MIVEVGLTVPDPTMLQVEPSASVTGESVLCDRKLENIIELHVMWFVAPESITHLFHEDKRHVFLDSANVVTEMDSLSDFWKWEYFAYSSVETRKSS